MGQESKPVHYSSPEYEHIPGLKRVNREKLRRRSVEHDAPPQGAKVQEYSVPARDHNCMMNPFVIPLLTFK